MHLGRQGVLIFFMLTVFCPKLFALTIQGFIQKIPSYLTTLHDRSEQKRTAATLLENFAPFLIRGYNIVLQKYGEDDANVNLDSICRWIAENNTSSPDAIHTNIVEHFRTMVDDLNFPMPMIDTVASPAPITIKNNGPIELLKQISRFSLDPVSGRERIVLHGGQAFSAHLQRFYNDAQGVNPDDWDFILLQKDLIDLLNALHIAPDMIRRLIAQSTLPVIDDYSEFQYLPRSAILAISFRGTLYPYPSLMNIKYIQFDFQKKVYKKKPELSIDFFFTQELPISSYLLFSSIGYLPVVAPLQLLKATKVAVTGQPYAADKHQSRLKIWRQFEEQNPYFSDNQDMLREIMSDDREPQNELTYDSQGHSETHSRKKKKRKSIQVVMPELLEQFDEPVKSKHNYFFKEKLRLRTHQSVNPRQQQQEQQEQKEQQQQVYQDSKKTIATQINQRLEAPNKLIGLVIDSSSPQIQEANFNAITTMVGELRIFQKATDDSVFIQLFEYSCTADSQDCKNIRAQYNYHLLKQELFMIVALNDMFSAINSMPETVNDHHLLHFAAQVKTLAIELNIDAKRHARELDQYTSFFSSDELGVIGELPDTLDELAELYYFLYSSFTRLNTHELTSGPTITAAISFRDQIKSWYDHLHYINKLVTHPLYSQKTHSYKVSSFSFPELQLLVFGVVLDDLPSLSETLPQSTSLQTDCPAATGKEEEDDEALRRTLLNTALEQVLSSKSWKNVYAYRNPFPPEKAQALLASLERFTLNDSHTNRIASLKAHWQSIETSLVEQSNAAKAKAKADKIAEKQQKPEYSLRSSRQNRHKHKGQEETSTGTVPTRKAIDAPPGATPQQETPLTDWEVNLSKARTAIRNKDISKGKTLYEKVLREAAAPQNIKAGVLVEIADVSLKGIAPFMAAIRKDQAVIRHAHSMFQNLLANSPGSSNEGSKVEREALLKATRQLANNWDQIEPHIEAITEHQRIALQALIELPNQHDTNIDYNKELLITSIESLTKFQYETMKGWGVLLLTYTLRREWLQRLALLRPPSIKARVQTTIPSLMKRVDTQKKKHTTLIKKSFHVQQQFKRKYGVSQARATTSQSLNDYKHFQVPGDGDCFFNAIAIAFNQLQHNQNSTAQSIRNKIHELLKQIVAFINSQPNNEVLQQEIHLLTGLTFDTLGVMVNENVLLQSSSASGCSAGSLQQYGEINYTLLLLLNEHFSLGVQTEPGGNIQNYSHYIWLNLAPNLLHELVHANQFTITHWPFGQELQPLLAQGPYVPPELIHQVEQEPLTAILLHSGNADSLKQHFNVAVLTEGTLQEMATDSTYNDLKYSSLMLLMTAIYTVFSQPH